MATLFGDKEPLKAQLTEAVSSIKTIVAKVDLAIARMDTRGKELLSCCAEQYAKGERERAMLYANEVALVRNLNQKLSKSRLALEVIEVRVETIMVTGDFASVLHPAIEAIRSVKDDIGPVIPQAEEQLVSVSSSLNDILVNSFHTDIKSIDGMFSTESGEQVLAEVMSLVGSDSSQQLPTPPQQVEAGSSTASQPQELPT